MGTRITDTDGADVDMLAWARDIAAALGKGWTAEKGVWEPGRDAYLNGPDGERLHIRGGTRYTNRDRVEISGSLERQFARYDEPRHEITVSHGKKARLVAGDITRRLLPGYREGMVLANQRKRNHEAAEAQQEHIASTLAGILPGAQRFDRNPYTVLFGGGKFRRAGGPIGGEAKVLYGGEVEWDIRGTESGALALAEAVSAVLRGK